jgi:Zn finger protein HypA/HybF involved in hydrogenase expression
MAVTQEEFIKLSKKNHSDEYDYSKVNYINKNTKVEIICPVHGSFFVTPNNHLKISTRTGESMGGCQICSKKKLLTQEEIIKRFEEVHGDKYIYKNVNYINKNTKVEIICPKHGSFFQTPIDHSSGHGCPKCAHSKKFLGNIEILKRFYSIYGNKYMYDLPENANTGTKIKITCPEHGEFITTVGEHFKHGCKKCAGTFLKTTEEAVKDFKKVHSDKYDYSKVNYINAMEKVEIICPKHGSFWQSPNNHLSSGHGCPKCTSTRSKAEEEIYEFIKDKYPDLEVLQNHKIGRMELDIYIPELKFAIEYNGVYWHSLMHPDKSTSKNQTNVYYNKKRHLNKFEACTQLEIHLFQINELEFLNPIKKDIWLSKILLKLGKIPNKIPGRKCTIKEVPKKESREFQEFNHLQGSINSQKHYGLYYRDELVQIFTLGASRYNGRYDYEIHRICTKKNTIVHGGVSKLYKHVLKELDNPKIITYANRRWSALNNSNLYKQLGLEYINESSPNFNVIDLKTNKTYPRNTFQKHKLEKISGFNYDPSLTAQENILNNDYIIQWDAGNGVYAKN